MSIPVGATHKLRGEFYREDIESWFRLHEGQWVAVDQRSWDFVTRHAAPITAEMRQAIAAQSWNGEGLPPVGLEVECTYSSWGYWLKGKVLCYGQKMIFMEQESSKGDGKFEGSMNPDGIKFRPIRTPEQIAAEERDKEIQSIVELMKSTRFGLESTDVSPREMARAYAEAIYAAGYRKQVAP